MVIDVEFKKKILSLVREDEEFRYALAGLLGLEAILFELKKLREDFLVFVKEQEKKWEENSKRWEENEKKWEEAFKRFEAIEKTLIEHTKIFEEHSKRLEELSRAVAQIHVTLGRLFGSCRV